MVGMSPATRPGFDDELARARLAFISAGQPPLGAPRRAAGEVDAEDTQSTGVASGTEASNPDPPGTSDVGRGPARDDPSRIRIFDRISVTPRQAVAVLVLLLFGVVVALTALGRSSASQLPVTPSPSVARATPTVEASVSSSPPVRIRVHVLGAVVSPGVVPLDQGAIVQDAVLACGGLLDDADPAELNLAAPLSDGQQVIVGTTAEPRGEVIQQPGSRPPGGAGEPVNLNTATAAELEELPGVGPVLAGAIVAWREENGGFGTVAQLQEVSGIGPKSFAKLEPLVTT